MGLAEILVAINNILCVVVDNSDDNKRELNIPKKPTEIIIHKLKNDGFIMKILREKQFKDRLDGRKTSPHLYPMEDELIGNFQIPKKKYQIPNNSILSNIDSCEDLQNLCIYPIWGVTGDKHTGTFTSDLFHTNMTECSCSW